MIGALVYVVFQVAAYLVWRIPANREKITRTDGRYIPWYATGLVGDALGLSFVAAAIGYTDPLPPLPELFIAFASGSIVVYWLHRRWKADSKRRTIALYLRSGKTTLAGKLHFAYAIFAATLIALVGVLWPEMSDVARLLSSVGFALYAIATVVDRVRGVI